jgi:hypothetical protein
MDPHPQVSGFYPVSSGRPVVEELGVTHSTILERTFE